MITLFSLDLRCFHREQRRQHRPPLPQKSVNTIIKTSSSLPRRAMRRDRLYSSSSWLLLITSRNLCGRNWKEAHPSGTVGQYAKHWDGLGVTGQKVWLPQFVGISNEFYRCGRNWRRKRKRPEMRYANNIYPLYSSGS